MDRRLLFLFAWMALGVWGCSREKSPPPVAAAAAPVKAEMRATAVSPSESSREENSIGAAGVGFSGSGFGGGGGESASRVSSSGPSSDLFGAAGPAGQPPIALDVPMSPERDAAIAQQYQRELAQRARAEEARRKALEEAKASAILGAFGPGNQSSESPSVLGTANSKDNNPLRTDAAPRFAPRSGSERAAPTATENPFRQSREPRIPAQPQTGLALPPVPPGAPGPTSAPSVAEHSPAGGSAPPWLNPSGGGSPIESRDVRAEGTERRIAGGGTAQPSSPLAFQPESPPRAIEEEAEFDVVEVLYGTDRLAGQQKASDFGHLLLQFLPTLAVAVLAVCLVAVGIRHRNWLLGTVAVTGLAACLLLGYDAVDEVLSRIRGATHQGPRYTTDRAPGGRIEVGRCEVTIPRTHVVGEVETPSIFRLEIDSDISRHLVLQKTERLGNPKFFDLLRHRVEKSERHELFVFVHGFNVSFEDAALRTAQIHHDLKFDGAPIFFSWPANDKFVFTYPADETNVAWSVPHLKQFLLEIVKESRAQSINLIAHSMGNRALAAALREIQLEMHDQARLFNQVILAAPDIDADDFRNNIAPAMQHTARGLTLYASSHDEALLASQFIHRRPRAGDAGDGLTVVAGVDTIDVTAIDKSYFGHSYYGSSHPVLHDLKALLSGAAPPRDRIWLSPAERDGLTYWIFQPARVAAAEARQTR